jgi:hypothetical protein
MEPDIKKTTETHFTANKLCEDISKVMTERKCKTYIFGEQPRRCLRVVKRFVKHCSCRLQGELSNLAIRCGSSPKAVVLY